MERTPSSITVPADLSRRAALARLGAIVWGMAVAGCAPRVIVSRVFYPESVALDDETIHRMLTAFVAVVIPEPEVGTLVAHRFMDSALRFADYRSPLAADLMRRTLELADNDRFDRLSIAQRRSIVQDGLDNGGVRARLYSSAVFLIRIVYFCGLWNERGACEFIGYEGAYVFAGHDAISWPRPERFLPAPITADGNPA